LHLFWIRSSAYSSNLWKRNCFIFPPERSKPTPHKHWGF